MNRRIIGLALVLAGCASNLGQWQFDDVASIELSMRELLPIGRYKLFPCSDSRPTGWFSVSYENGDVERHSFCHENAGDRSWGLLKIKNASREICFYEEYEIEADTVILGTSHTDCHSSPHEVIYLPLL